MPTDPLKAITGVLEEAENTTKCGMFLVKTANQTVEDARKRPDPVSLWRNLWYEGEVCCLFADSNLGKSILAVQMADEIARTRRVLYIDCELSDKQFQLRYTSEDGLSTHTFPPGFLRAEIDPMFIMPKNAEELMLQHIEQTAENLSCDTVMVDNIGYLCNNMDKGQDAGSFMQKLKMLKIKHDWNLLIIAHTPKRALCSPITRNDLAGSSRLFNFFDSVFAIGQSAKDHDLRYIKQVKVRHGKFEYGPENVITCEIVHDYNFVHFRLLETCPERDHLKERTDKDIDTRDLNIKDLYIQGKSYREIADELSLSKSLVGNVINRLKEKGLLSSVQPSKGMDGMDSVDTAGQEVPGTLFDNESTDNQPF